MNFWVTARGLTTGVVHGLGVHLALEAESAQQALRLERVVPYRVTGVERRKELVDRSHAATPTTEAIVCVKVALVRTRSKSRRRASAARLSCRAQRRVGEHDRDRLGNGGRCLVGEAEPGGTERLGHR